MAKDKIIEAPKFEIAAMEMGMEEVKDILRANCGPEGMDAFDLTRAVNPTGENTEWKIPGLEDEPEMTNMVEGVIIYHRLVRAYWEGKYKGKGAVPPNCSANDAMTGEGNPGGSCLDCPFAKFGSGDNNSQACRVIKQLFIVRSGELLPTLINISAVNVKRPKKYLLDLLSKRRLKFNQVITRIRLEPDVSGSGFDFARSDFSLASVLPEEQMKAAAELTAIFTPLLASRDITIDVTPDAVAAPGETFDPDGAEVPY